MERFCDRCGEELTEQKLRYVARIQVFAAYDPLEISFDELQRDYTAEIHALAEQCKEMSEEELMRDVYVAFEFDLCPACQKTYIRDPLPVAER